MRLEQDLSLTFLSSRDTINLWRPVMDAKDKRDFLKQYRELQDGKVETSDTAAKLLTARGIVLLDGYHDFLGGLPFSRVDN